MDEGDNAHLCLTLGALKGIHFIDSLYARAPTALTELTAIVALWFFRGRRRELSAFPPSPAGVATVVSRDALVGLRYMARKRCQKLKSVKLPPTPRLRRDRRAPHHP